MTYDPHDTGPNDSDADKEVNLQSISNAINDGAIQTSWDGLVVPVGPGLGMQDAIDPSSTATPIQDAINVVAGTSRRGCVLLPPASVDENGTITRESGVGIIGWGIGDDGGSGYGSRINITQTTSAGMAFPDGTNWIFDDGYRLQGPGSGASTGIGIDIQGTTWQYNVGRLELKGWSNIAIKAVDLFESHWKSVQARTVDAGDKNAMFDLDGAGPAVSIGTLAGYPDDSRTAADTTILFTTAPHIDIQMLNIGGTANQACNIYGGDGNRVQVGAINYEPSGQNSSAIGIVDAANDCHVTIGSLKMQSGNASFAYRQKGGGTIGNNIFGPFANKSPNSLTNVVQLTEASDEPSWYWGPASDVTNDTGAADGSTGFQALATAGTEV